MNLAEFQNAYARLLVDRSVRATVLSGDEHAMSRPGAENSLLGSLEATGVNFSAEAVTATRLRLLRRALPGTVSFLEATANGPQILQDFVAAQLPLIVSGGAMNRLVAEADRFARYIAAGRLSDGPPWLPDLAAYEHLLVRLTFDEVASKAAAACAEALLLNQISSRIGRFWDETYFCLGDHVVPCEFSHEVIELGEWTTRPHRSSAPPLSTFRKTSLLICKQAGKVPPSTYRIGSITLATLRMLDGARLLSEVQAQLGPQGSGEFAGDSLRRTVATAFRAGCLYASSTPRNTRA